MSTSRTRKPRTQNLRTAHHPGDPRMLTAADFLNQPLERLEIPELGGYVYLKPLPAADVIAFSDRPKEETNEALFHLVAKAVVDGSGRPLFPTPADVERLKQVSISIYNRIALRVMGQANEGSGAESTEGKG